MIITSLTQFMFNMILSALEGLSLVGLPYDAIHVLSDIICYGVWVVGVDLLVIFVSSVVGWWAIKFSVGFVVFIWELLPLT